MADFGVFIFATDYSIGPVDFSLAAEARGFESVFLPEHTHIPASRVTPWPGGADLPREYWHTHDPFIALGAAAAVTKTIKLGTGISLVTERDPIVLAKEAATLDFLSDGRLLMGVGAGWNVEEMSNHGTDFSARWAILRERIKAIRTIWTEEEAEYHGQYVDFDSIWSYPKPKQQGGPKILIGASSKWTPSRIAEYGDGWFPIYQNQARAQSQGSLDYRDFIDRVRQEWKLAERSGDPDLTVFGVGPKPDIVKELVEIGFNRIVFGLPSGAADEVLPLLDRYAAIGHEINC